MKFTLRLGVAVILAGLSTAQYTNESAPFHLVLISDNATVDGDTLSACHVGAAIESLCLSNGSSTSKPNPIAPAVFHFNTSDQVVTPNTTLGAPGVLTYELPSSPPIPSGLGLFIDPTTNFALPLLYPGGPSGTTGVMAFDEEDLLNLQGYVNYGTSPPTGGDTVAYYRWFSCMTYYMGYEYVNLVWALGRGEPETPGCVPVSVKRVFI